MKAQNHRLMNCSFFNLNLTLSAYFGQQFFTARPELKDSYADDGNNHIKPSSLCLATLSEEEIRSTRPSEIGRLFKPH